MQSQLTKQILPSFLWDKWQKNEQLEPVLGPTHLYLGGFKEETKSVMLAEGSVMHVPALQSTQQHHTPHPLQYPE